MHSFNPPRARLGAPACADRPSPLTCAAAVLAGALATLNAKYLAAAFLILWLALGGQ